MKTKIGIVAFLLFIVSVGSATARGGWGNGSGYYNSRGPGYGYQQLTPENQAKLNTFYTETQELRKQIMMKQAEKLALLRTPNADPGAVSKVSGELFDLVAAMQEKAKAAGVTAAFGGAGYGRGMGGGRGMMYGCRMM